MATVLRPYTVEVLDKSGDKQAEIKNLYPLNEQGDVIRYSKELSDWGEATIRISTKDPFLTEQGDIIVPHKYQLQIKRKGSVVWRGGIIENSERNRNYIEVKAAQYLFYLDKVLIRRDTEVTSGDGKKHYKVYDSGTMKSAVQTLISNAASDFGSNHILGNMSAGTVENPTFPDNFTDANGDPLTGGWTFSDNLAVQFDYHSALYVLSAFGIYSKADFELTDDLEFNFKKRIGTTRDDIIFEYSTRGNIVDYNIPRLGKRMANDLTGIAATDEGVILHSNKRDEASIKEYGLLQEPAAYADVKNKNLLNVRLSEELRFISNPEYSPINIILNERGIPFSQYDIGDIVRVKVKDHNIDYDNYRQIVGATVTVHNTGRELVTVQTNRPRPEQL